MKLKRFPSLIPCLCGALTLLVCAGSSMAEVVLPVVAESGSVIVTTETAEVREGPALGYDVLTVVAKGEIFVKQGRTESWYYIRVNENSFGWISGRAISRHLADEAPLTYVEPRDGPVESEDYPYYPNNYYGYFYDYPFYFWGQPYFSSDYYYYDYYRYRGYPRGYVHPYPRNRVYPRYWNNGWQGGGGGPQRRFYGGRVGVPVPRFPGPVPRFNNPAPRPATPSVRPPFPRR